MRHTRFQEATAICAAGLGPLKGCSPHGAGRRERGDGSGEKGGRGQVSGGRGGAGGWHVGAGRRREWGSSQGVLAQSVQADGFADRVLQGNVMKRAEMPLPPSTVHPMPHHNPSTRLPSRRGLQRCSEGCSGAVKYKPLSRQPAPRWRWP